MRRIAGLGSIAITILVATTGATPAAARPKSPPSCEKTSERFSARQAEWETFTSKSFTAALAREGLTVPTMVQRKVSWGDKMLEHAKVGSTFTIGSGADAQLALFARVEQTYFPPTDEFVQDAQGVIHPLVREEHLVGSETHALCGCGPMGGGVVPPMLAVVYLLPPGATYDPKPVELEYDARHVEVRWRNVVDGKEVACEPPP